MEPAEANAALRALGGDMNALKQYVTAQDHNRYKNLAENLVCLHVTHQHLRKQFMDIRLDRHMTIGDVKGRLYLHVGTLPGQMELQLRSNGRVLAVLNDDSKKLGFYSPESGMELHIMDLDPNSLAKGGWLENVNLVQKYEISDADYEKREKSVRAYKKKMLAEDPNWKAPVLPGSSTATKENKPIPGPESVSGINVGDRCEVDPGKRRGEIAFVGEIPQLAAGPWVGVRLDEPAGKGDGTVKGERIFDCKPRYGAIVRGDKVVVGDFPERNILDELEDSDEEI